jgi:hypothetical protein
MKLPKVGDSVLMVGRTWREGQCIVTARWPMLVIKVRANGFIDGYVTPNTLRDDGSLNRTAVVPQPFDLTSVPPHDPTKPAPPKDQASFEITEWEFPPAPETPPAVDPAREQVAAPKK